MPLAARISDMHTCPAVTGTTPHVGGPVISGSADVSIGFLPAARVSDKAVCVPAIDSISAGSATVSINHKQAARIGDPTAHGGVIVAGCPTVTIGDSSQSLTLGNAATAGAPFCEECEKARKAGELRAPNRPPPTPARSVEMDPPPAASTATAPRPSPAERAKSPGATPDQVAARENLAWGFLGEAAQGRSPAEVDALVRSLDLDQPLEVASVAEGAGADPKRALVGFAKGSGERLVMAALDPGEAEG